MKKLTDEQKEKAKKVAKTVGITVASALGTGLLVFLGVKAGKNIKLNKTDLSRIKKPKKKTGKFTTKENPKFDTEIFDYDSPSYYADTYSDIDDFDFSDEALSLDDAALYWACNGCDEDCMFDYSWDELYDCIHE